MDNAGDRDGSREAPGEPERAHAGPTIEVEETPSGTSRTPRRTRRGPGIFWRLAFHTRAGIAHGFLRFWPVWERIMLVFIPTQPIPGAPSGLFRVHFGRYLGKSITLPDGTTVKRGDLVCELHMSNVKLTQITDTWALIRALGGDLRALAAWAEQPDFPARVRALYGYSLLSRGAPRLGFTLRDRRITLYARLERFFLMGLLALYNAQGVERLRHGTTFAHYPQELWMSRDELRRRYGADAPRT